MTNANHGNHLSITIELGQLTWAGNAVPGYYHVQDPKTRELHQVMAVRPAPWNRRTFDAVRRVWIYSSWLKPVTGLAAALVVVGSAGLYQAAKSDGESRQKRALIEAIPFAPPATNDVRSDVKIVAAPYVEEERPMGQTARSASPLDGDVAPAAAVMPPQLLQAPTSPPQSLRLATAPMPAPPGRLALPAKAQAADRMTTPANEGRQADASSVIVNEDPGHVSAPKSSKANEAVAKPVDVARATPSKAFAAGPAVAGFPEPRLVAIQDAQSILVTSPTTRLPIRVTIGSALPSGRKLTSIDTARGVATLDDGSSLRLE